MRSKFVNVPRGKFNFEALFWLTFVHLGALVAIPLFSWRALSVCLVLLFIDVPQKNCSVRTEGGENELTQSYQVFNSSSATDELDLRTIGSDVRSKQRAVNSEYLTLGSAEH